MPLSVEQKECLLNCLEADILSLVEKRNCLRNCPSDLLPYLEIEIYLLKERITTLKNTLIYDLDI